MRTFFQTNKIFQWRYLLKIYRFAITPFFLILFTSSSVSAKISDTLHLNKCIDLALKNYPLSQNAEGNVISALGNYLVNRSSFLPQLSFQSQTGESYPSSSSGKSAGGNQLSAQISNGLTFQQMIFDFGRTSAKVSASKSLWKSSMADSQNASQNIIFTAIASYFALAQARAVEQLSIQAYNQSVQHLVQAKALYEAGRNVRYTMVRAQIDTSSARLNLIRARNSSILCKEQLAVVIAQPIPDSIILPDSTFTNNAPVTYDSAYTIAIKNRSDLQSARLKVTSAEAQVKAARTSYFPIISASATGGYRYNDQPTKTEAQYYSGNILLTIPLTTGGAVRGVILQNEGNLEAAGSTVKMLEQSIQSDVRQQLANIDEVTQRIILSQSMIEQSKLALDLAKERFSAGTGNNLELIDAETGFTNSGMALIQARYDYAVANARFQKTLGTLKIPSER